MVALDYRTGQYRWHFQIVIHEIWDYDLPNPPLLFDQMYNGVMKKGVSHAAKTGWLYLLDRTNGEPLVGMDYRPVPPDPYPGASANQNAWPVQPYPVGDPYVEQCPEPMAQFPFVADKAGCIFTSYWEFPVLLRPPNNGGTNWSPTSYHPPTGYIFVNGNEANQATTADIYAPREHTVGKNYTRQVNAPVPGSTITQTFTAMDSRTNKIVWQHRMPGGQSYGWASTAGNLAFAGNVDGNLQAFNAQTGEILWKFQTGWAVGAPPMVYAVDGVEYVAVASGGNRGGFQNTDGDAVWAFSLNGTIDEVASPGPVQSKVPVPTANTRIGQEVGNAVTLGGTWIFDGTIRTLDFRFEPAGVIIDRGTTLTWNNMGSSIHTASDTKGAWDTGDFGAGESRAVTFNAAGTYDYLCKPHPWMIGRIQVNE
jgi:alcohol dehydrogenase (cytochrome c)